MEQEKKQDLSIDQCVDFNKEVASGFKTKLYHATTAIEKICESGIRPSSEKKADVLGSSVSPFAKTISFTIDKNIGVAIAKDLKNAVRIMNGDIHHENIAEELDKSDGNERIPIHFIKPINPSHCAIIESSKPIDDHYYPLDDRISLQCDKTYTRSMKKKPSEIWHDLMNLEVESLKHKYGASLEDRFYYCKRAKNKEQHRGEIEQREDLAWCWSKAYLYLRSLHGGRHDPYFAGTHWKAMVGSDVKDVGLLEYKGYLPKQYVNIGNHRFFTYYAGDYVENNPDLTIDFGFDEMGDPDYDLDIELDNYFKGGELINKEIKLARNYIQLKKIHPLEYDLPEDTIHFEKDEWDLGVIGYFTLV